MAAPSSPSPSTAMQQRFSRVEGNAAARPGGNPQRSAMDGLHAAMINTAIGAASELEPIVPGTLAIGTVIGKGRFKRVHRGWSTQHGAVVVLCYTVAEPATASLSEADQNEINITARLAKQKNSGKYLPRVFGTHVEGGNVTIAQELALWGSLKVVLKEKKTSAMLTAMHKTHASKQFLRAMHYLGQCGVVHADMACRNILLCWLEENPATIQVKVTDFGLAVIVDPETGFIIHRQPQATRWCSPEMIAHHKLSHLADVWGAGATIWEMFANGEMPWVKRKKREDVGARLRALAENHGAPEGPDVSADFQAPPGMPPEVHAAMMTCFTLDEAARPKAGDVAAQIAIFAPDGNPTAELAPLEEIAKATDASGLKGAGTMGKNSSMLSAEMMNGTSTMMSALPEGMSLFKSITGFLSTAETSRLVDAKTIAAMKQEISQAEQRETFLRTRSPGLEGPLPVFEDVVPLCYERNTWVQMKAEGMPTDGTWSMWTYTSPAMKRQDYASELDALMAFEKVKNSPCMLKDPTGKDLASKAWASGFGGSTASVAAPPASVAAPPTVATTPMLVAAPAGYPNVPTTYVAAPASYVAAPPRVVSTSPSVSATPGVPAGPLVPAQTMNVSGAYPVTMSPRPTTVAVRTLT